eukprot:g10391.t1
MDTQALQRLLSARNHTALDLSELHVRAAGQVAGVAGGATTPAPPRARLRRGPRSGRDAGLDRLSYVYTDEVWAAVLERPRAAALEVLSRHLLRIGLRNPSEPTQAVVAAVLCHKLTDAELPDMQGVYQGVKAKLRADIAHAPSLTQGFAPAPRRLPLSPADAPPALLAAVGARVDSRLDCLELFRRAWLVRMRARGRGERGAPQEPPQQASVLELFAALIRGAPWAAERAPLALPPPPRPRAPLLALEDGSVEDNNAASAAAGPPVGTQPAVPPRAEAAATQPPPAADTKEEAPAPGAGADAVVLAAEPPGSTGSGPAGVAGRQGRQERLGRRERQGRHRNSGEWGKSVRPHVAPSVRERGTAQAAERQGC